MKKIVIVGGGIKILVSAIAALCFKRSEATTAAAAKPGPRGLCVSDFFGAGRLA